MQCFSFSSGSSTTEYGIAMGAAVVAVLLVLFGVGLCLCVILQYLRQQRDGPEGQYRPALSRDVYSVEAVNLGMYYMAGIRSQGRSERRGLLHLFPIVSSSTVFFPVSVA